MSTQPAPLLPQGVSEATPTKGALAAFKPLLLKGAVGLACLATFAGGFAYGGGQVKDAAQKNLITLVHQLDGTTGQIVNRSADLKSRVGLVDQRLSLLPTQVEILQEQTNTGQQLSAALNTQQQLTQHGVQLMQQILSKERTNDQLTEHLSLASGSMIGTLTQNANSLQQLLGALQTATNGSAELNQQLNTLLAALQQSLTEFRLFGQLHTLLSQLPNLLQKSPLGGVTAPVSKALGDTVSSLGNATSSLGQSLASTGGLGKGAGGLLSSLGKGMSSLNNNSQNSSPSGASSQENQTTGSSASSSSSTGSGLSGLLSGLLG